MLLINCEVELILSWPTNCFIISTNVANQGPTFTITETNLYVSAVTLWTQDNAKLLPQLNSGFKRTISWNKDLAKPELLPQNANLNHLIEPSFHGVNRLFVLAFEDDAQKTSNKKYYLPNVEINDYNVMIDGKTFFNQPIKNDKVTYENIRKIATVSRDDLKAIQQFNFTANLDRAGNARFCFILEEAKETAFECSEGTIKVLWAQLRWMQLHWIRSIV